MPVNLRDFMDAMTHWASDLASEEASSALPPSSWMKVRMAGTEVPGGTVFSPAVIVQMALAGRYELQETVAEPLAQFLNDRFGPAQAEGGFPWQVGPHETVPGPGPVAGSEAGAGQEPPEHQSGLAAPEAVQEAAAPAAASQSAAASPEQPGDSQEPAESFLFPAYDYSREDLDSAEPDGPHCPVAVERFEGRLRYTWPDTGAGEVYRVVVSDLEDPYSPDDFDEVAVTREPVAWDSTPITTAVRFVTVWAYEEYGGGLGQCRRVASKVVVHELRDWAVEMEQDTGAVVGSWTRPEAPPATSVVIRSARLPLNQSPGRFIKTAAWLGYELANNGSGFRDAEVVGGKKYNYVAAVEVTVNGQTHSSKPALRSIVPDVAVERIMDLEAVEVPDPDRQRPSTLTVTWTQDPHTKVVLYRTQKPVSEEARSRDAFPQSQLAEAHLPEDAQISTRLVQLTELPDSNRCAATLTEVTWPEGESWDALYLTPVTFHSEDQATIGKPLRLKRAGVVRNATLVRRLTWDLVTFTWPGEAASVELRRTLPGQQVDPNAPADVTVSKEEYHGQGGLVLPEALPPEGGELHLNSLTYLEGRQIPSQITSIVVPPRWVYEYQIKWPGEMLGNKGIRVLAMLRQTLVEVHVSARQGFTDPASAVWVVLIHNPSRLPLSPDDGTPVPLFTERPTKEGGQTATQLAALPGGTGEISLWFDHAQLPPGYLRLMVNSSAASQIAPEYQHLALEHYCLVDPDLSSLVKDR